MSVFHVPLVKTKDDSYDIQIGRALFKQCANDLAAGLCGKAHRFALITDSNINPLYGNTMLIHLKAAGITAELFMFPAGEASNTRETKAVLEDRMIESRFGRDSAVIALGGGVVSDLAGFLAGTFGRGIPFVVYSTTLLSAADASVGGKTAVDTPAATNLIGLFNQPKKVYIDLDTWDTLPSREISSGLAETIKHACMADIELFEFLEKNVEKLLPASSNINKDTALHIARRNCEIKYHVVAADPIEENLRQVLNLGHTVGRALETLAGFTLLHGEAVSVGLVAQLRLGVRYGYANEDDLVRVRTLLVRAGLPVKIPPGVKIEQLSDKLYTDKKVRKDTLRFVFQKGIGEMMQFDDGLWSRPVPEKDIKAVLADSY
ncbi:MAG: 3-dehydroquinate synthase [Spirochaetaceae bacterium]|nr:MAG: 3-dehydroquinate synthase [Spirochaetaceae bacterium]